MALFLRRMNSLYKHGIKAPNSCPLNVKLLETSKTKSHVCALFILSSNHQYSTLQNEKTLRSTCLLNHRLDIATIASCHHLSTDSKMDQVQAIGSKSLQAQTESTSTFVTTEAAGGYTTTISSDSIPAESVFSSTGFPVSDHAETILSSGNLSEDLAVTLTDTLSTVDNVEVPLSALGLAGWSPVGLVRQFIELLHVHLDLPWWAAIVAATFTARMLLFPVLVKTRQNAVRVSNYMPQLQVLQKKFNQARMRGNTFEASKAGLEMKLFMDAHEINPLKSALIPLMQAPVFISFFLGLRSMAQFPVESLKTGGISWIMDLTVPDPYYITPLLTCSTLYIIIKIGAESGMEMQNMKLVHYLLIATPIIVFPFTINFPAAVLCYWCATNLFTLVAVSVFKVDWVRRALNIPEKNPINLDPEFISKKKGFIAGIKEAYEDQKMASALNERHEMDEVRFRKAGTGPVPRTYSYDPTKSRPAAAAAARKAQR